MKHKTLETKTTATDLGEFSALAATYSLDRVGDEIKPGAFEKTITRWQTSGKRIPLHWDHEGSADSIIGYVMPDTMQETEKGLYVEGKLDLEDSEVAREAWRSMKNDAVALSFGYLATIQHKRSDGVNELREIDLFEISVVPAPANPDTRFLSLKNASSAVEDGGGEEPEKAKPAPQDPLVKEAWALLLPKSQRSFEPEPEPEPEPELNPAQVQRDAWALLTKTSG